MRHWTTKHIEEIGGGSGLDLSNLSERIMIPDFEEVEVVEKDQNGSQYYHRALYRTYLKNTIDGSALVSLVMSAVDVLDNNTLNYKSGIGINVNNLLHYCYNLPHNTNYEPAEQKALLVIPVFKGARIFVETCCDSLTGRLTEEEIENQKATIQPNSGRIVTIENARVYK